MFASLLEHLDGQQKAIPASERGLDSRLTELRQRLAQDPSLESNARFQVGVAWLLQDWKQMSGTGQQPWLPPREAAFMQSLKVNLPGLENEDVKNLLRNAEGLHDQKLLTELRNEALRIAELPPGEQLALAVIKNLAVFEYRVQQARSEAPQQNRAASPLPQQEPSHASLRELAEAPTHTTSTRSETTPPAYEPGEAPGGPDFEAATQDQHSNSSRAEESRPKHPEDAEIKKQEGSPEADARMRREDQQAAKRAQAIRPDNKDASLEPPASIKKDGHSRAATGADAPVRPPSANPSASVPTAGTHSARPAQTPKGERTGPGAVEKIVEAGKGIGASFTKWTNSRADDRDQKRMTELAKKVDVAAQTVEEDISAFRTTGARFFGELEKAAQRDGKTHQEIIAGMHEKGPYARLRQQFDKALADNPVMGEQHATLRASLNTLNNRVRNLNLEARQSDMQESPVVLQANKGLQPLAEKLEKLPATEPGANMLERAGNFVVQVVEQLRRFLDQARGKEAQRERGSSPSMSR